MDYYDIYSNNNNNNNSNTENFFQYWGNTTGKIKCKGDSMETEIYIMT